jgi:hypothetical protein
LRLSVQFTVSNGCARFVCELQGASKDWAIAEEVSRHRMERCMQAGSPSMLCCRSERIQSAGAAARKTVERIISRRTNNVASAARCNLRGDMKPGAGTVAGMLEECSRSRLAVGGHGNTGALSAAAAKEAGAKAVGRGRSHHPSSIIQQMDSGGVRPALES